MPARTGVIAQLVERLNGIEEVWGSTPHGSTRSEARFPRENQFLPVFLAHLLHDFCYILGPHEPFGDCYIGSMAGTKNGKNRAETRGLYQRNGTWWFQPPMKDGRRPRPFSLGVTDLAEAIVARRDVLVNGREFIEERTPSSLDVLVKEYLAAKRKNGDFRGKTATNVESSLGLLVRHFANVAGPASVTAKMAQDYHDHWIAQGKSEATARTYTMQAAAFFSLLRRVRWSAAD